MAAGVRPVRGGATYSEEDCTAARGVRPPAQWSLRERSIPLGGPGGPIVMGVLNVTPDSFSDGGRFSRVEAALAHAEDMVAAGAAILDVGGESTRPGAPIVHPEEELSRVLPVVREARKRWNVRISVDTRNASVAEAALDAGADIVNDVSSLTHDPSMAAVVRDARAGVVLMHMRGTPITMTSLANYGDVVADVRQELGASVRAAEDAGISREAIVVDPGIGFAKTPEQSLELIARLDELLVLGRPLLVGTSRKSFLGKVLDLPAEERVEGTIASCVMAFERGASLFRVHDVSAVVRALRVADAVLHASKPEGPE